MYKLILSPFYTEKGNVLKCIVHFFYISLGRETHMARLGYKEVRFIKLDLLIFSLTKSLVT